MTQNNSPIESKRRLIIYFPVSALVTLFANILQNPQDPRARSDVKLMNQVVNFLSLLSVTEEQGGVKRMLGVCSEFERIARVVLEKSDKSSSRHKRKSSKMTDNNEDRDHPLVPQQVPQKRPAGPPTPPSNNAPTPQDIFTSHLSSDLAFNPNLNAFSSPSFSDVNLPLDFTNTSNNQDFPNMLATTSPSNIDTNNNKFNLPDISQFPTENSNSPLNMGAFQHPFVPQDLWNMPMTLEWDWVDMNIDGLGQGFGEGQNVAQGTRIDFTEHGSGHAQGEVRLNGQGSAGM